MALTPLPVPSHGNRKWSVTTAPANEPVAVDELKEFARIDGVAEEELLTNIIKMVREAVERYLGRALITQTITLLMDYWPGTVFELPRPPLIAITSIATLDEDDTATVYDATNYYIVKDGYFPGRLVIKNGVTVPMNTVRYTGGFRIIYTAGYGTSGDDVPTGIKEGILHWANYIYETRLLPTDPPDSVKAILDQYRITRI